MIKYKTFFIFVYGLTGEFTWKIKRKDGSVFEESNESIKFATEEAAENDAREYIDEWET